MSYFKFGIVIFVFLLSVFISLTNFLDHDGNKIKLGLDIQGGVQFTYQVKEKEVIDSYIDKIGDRIFYFLNEEEIKNKYISKSDNLIYLDKRISKIDKILEILNSEKYIEFIDDNNKIKITFIENLKKEFFIHTKKELLNVLNKRIDKYGLANASIYEYGEDSIKIEIAGVDTIQEKDNIKKIIEAKTDLKIYHVADNINSYIINKYNLSDTPEEKFKDNETKLLLEIEYFKNLGFKFIDFKKMKNNGLFVNEFPIISGNAISNVEVGFDHTNKPKITFFLNDFNKEIFSDFTSKNIGQHIAIVLNNEIIISPVIQNKISDGRVSISGNISLNESVKISNIFQSGMQDNNLYITDERFIDSKLGKNNVNKSIFAFVFSFISILVFILFFFKKEQSLIIVFSILLNSFLIISVLTIFGTTLTIPGIAGLILIIGLSIDANIIIKERIFEVIKKTNRTFKNCLEEGYQTSVNSILDANITTFLAAIVLFQMGDSLIKGFAITLMIGIVTSLFSSIFATKQLNLFITKGLK